MPPLLSSSTPSSLLATSLTNLSSSRFRPPSLTAQREEGWTEVWGGKETNNNKDDGSKKSSAHLPSRYIHVLDDDCDCITGASAKKSSEAATTTRDTSSSSLLTLTQYRVAWYEQIILRMCQIPHTVDNSSYAARECTGALPCLLDLNDDCGQQRDENNNHSSGGGDGIIWNNSSLSKSNRPVYIGRNQPGGLGSYFFHQIQSGSGTRMPTNNNGTTGDDAPPPDAPPPPQNEVHPSWFVSSGSHIVDYLRMKHSNSMMQRVLFPEHLQQQPQQHSPNNYSSDAMAYETLIQDKLNYILLALRYGHDPTWESVYKQQCIRASLDPNDTSSSSSSSSSERKNRWGFFSLFAWYQTYSERALALCHILPSRCATTGGGRLALDLFRHNDYRCGDNGKKKKEGSLEQDGTDEMEVLHHQHHPVSGMVPTCGGVGGGDSGSVNVYRAMEYADMYYTSLEQKMTVVVEGSSPTYFLGTSIPSYIDALLFSHLAEALCDVHLVLVLAKHSRLMKYFQWMYDQYFGEKYAAGGGATDVEWVKWNNVSNTLNAFNQIPEAAALKKKGLDGEEKGNTGGVTHAISLMQQLAIHCHELDEAMRDAATARMKGGRERIVLEKQHRPIGSTLYKWLMGIELKLWGSKSSKKSLSTGAGKSKTNNDGTNDEEEHGDSEDAKKAMWEKHMEKVKRDRRYSDEVWISGVAVTFVGALLLSYSKSKK